MALSLHYEEEYFDTLKDNCVNFTNNISSTAEVPQLDFIQKFEGFHKPYS